MSSPSSPPSIPSPPPHPVLSTPPPSPHPHPHLFTPRTATSSPLSRPASRHSRRPRPAPLPPSPLALSDASASVFVSRLGFPRYSHLFSTIRLPLHALLALTNHELRDDVGVAVLAHRRALLAAFAAETARRRTEETKEGKAIKGSVPEFGRILVHLSNVRTFHSWLGTGTQAAIFAVALGRLAPGVRDIGLARGAGAGLLAVAVAAQVYGGVRYARVQRRIEDNGRDFTPDFWGVGGVLLLELGVAAVVVYVLLLDGFVPDGPG